MRLTFEFTNPEPLGVIGYFEEAFAGADVITRVYTAETLAEQEFEANCAAKGLQWTRSRGDDRVEALTVEGQGTVRLVLKRLSLIPAVFANKVNRVTIER